MFMAFHSSDERKPILIAGVLMLLLIGIGLSLSVR